MTALIGGPYHEALFWQSKEKFEQGKQKKVFAAFGTRHPHAHFTRSKKRSLLSESSEGTEEGNGAEAMRSQQKKILLTDEVFDSYEPVPVCTGCELLGGCVECGIFNTSSLEAINFSFF